MPLADPELLRGSHGKPYTLLTASTPNGWKASITLEELGVDYHVVPIALYTGEQKQPSYTAINPNGRSPRSSTTSTTISPCSSPAR